MQVERADRQHLRITVEDDDELADWASGSSIRVRIRELDHPDADATVDADIVYAADRDLYVASWYYDGIVRRRVNRAEDPRTRYHRPGDEGYDETSLAPPGATVLWRPKLPRDGQGGARPDERD